MNGIGTRNWRLNTQKNSADLRLREDVNMDGIGISPELAALSLTG